MLGIKTQTLDFRKGPLLLFGGPLSNLQATQSLQQTAAELSIPAQSVICTGDLAAYCGAPAETIDLIREWGIHVVMGNCEESLAESSEDCGCGFESGTTCSALSDAWFRYCNQHVSQEQRDWMGALPRTIRFQLQGISFLVVHGAPSRINRFIFASTPPRVKQKELEFASSDVVIGGHSGIPFGERLNSGAWLNSGVIGMPANDGTRDGWYLLLNPKAGGIEASWHRLSYNHQAAAHQMMKQGLDNGYADTLYSGLWPSMDVLPETERREAGQALTPKPLLLETARLSEDNAQGVA